MDKQNVNCVACDITLTISWLNQLFSPQFIEDLNDELLRIQLLADSNMVQCKCKNFIELVPGEPDFKVKDEENKVISKQSAKHMAKHRVRCNQCNEIF
jgi:hypothetical protein